ncbi:MAG: Dabb family protein [Desulfuromonadales bacterium]|nr:MAG: Dabb family protein [Desulfuromonadales bacterium]
MITHIVFFKLHEPTAAIIGTTRELLESMGGEIPLLRHLEVGVDVIRSERSYDLALVTKFDSLEDLQAYQVHPYHAGTVVPHMKSVSSAIAAVDYVSA